MAVIQRRAKHGMGWRPQLPDHRDLLYAAPPHVMVSLPSKVDLGPHMPPVYDQGDLGSCTANAIAGAIQFERMKQGLPDASRVPSRLMVYFDERVIEGTVDSDAGADIRDGIKSVATTGTCFEDGPDGWPYDVAKFTDKPPDNCYAAALRDRAVQYMKVLQDTKQMRGCLAAGFPFAFGFSCYPEIDSDRVAQTGILPMPRHSERPVGGHAVLAIGYDDSKRMFKVRNSWGADWGLKGYYWMPYEYLGRADLSSDFWTIRLMSVT